MCIKAYKLPAVLVIYRETFSRNQAVHFGMQKNKENPSIRDNFGNGVFFTGTICLSPIVPDISE